MATRARASKSRPTSSGLRLLPTRCAWSAGALRADERLVVLRLLLGRIDVRKPGLQRALHAEPRGRAGAARDGFGGRLLRLSVRSHGASLGDEALAAIVIVVCAAVTSRSPPPP